MKRYVSVAAITTVLSLTGFAAGQAQAGQASLNLPNTGAGLTSNGQVDSNYTVISVPSADPASTQATALVSGWPIGDWVAAPTGSTWISAEGFDQNLDPSANGTYDYQLSFQLPQAAEVSISGVWSADNAGSILFNGQATSSSNDATFWNVLTPFSISGLGVAGVNTLDFDVVNWGQNGGNPTGLVVAFTDPSYSVPEPATWAMMGLGFAGLAFAGYRSRRTAAAIA